MIEIWLLLNLAKKTRLFLVTRPTLRFYPQPDFFTDLEKKKSRRFFETTMIFSGSFIHIPIKQRLRNVNNVLKFDWFANFFSVSVPFCRGDWWVMFRKRDLSPISWIIKRSLYSVFVQYWYLFVLVHGLKKMLLDSTPTASRPITLFQTMYLYK